MSALHCYSCITVASRSSTGDDGGNRPRHRHTCVRRIVRLENRLKQGRSNPCVAYQGQMSTDAFTELWEN